MKADGSSTSNLRATALAAVSLALAALIGLAATELALRLLDISAEPQLTKRELRPVPTGRARTVTYYHCFASNPNGEFDPAPDVTDGSWRLFNNMLVPRQLPLSQLEQTPWCVEYVLSDRRLQLRDWSPPAGPRAGRLRLAVVGDSFVRGIGVPSEKTLPAQLETLLDRRRLSVINSGIPGADLQTEVKILRRVLKRLRPQAALVVFIPNDVRLSEALGRRQDYINDLIVVRDEYLSRHAAQAWYTGGPRLLQIVGSFLEMRKISRSTIAWYLDSYEPRHNRAGLERLARDLAALTRIPDCRVGLVLYPLMVGFERGYPLASVHATVARLAREAGLPVLDLAPAFAGMDTESLRVHPTDHHPNGRAHAIAAREIADWLRHDVPDLLPNARP